MMRHRRPMTDRLQDRLWSIYSRRRGMETSAIVAAEAAQGSISGPMAWPRACAAFANGQIDSKHFRRLRAVLEVVETLAPCDGRHHAREIRKAGHASWFDHPEIRRAAAWGDPLVWPGFMLETPQAFAPTSLRYLSHALWLNTQGFIGSKSKVIEIGVGYGGLAAMNAIVSGVNTELVDLPDVSRAAIKMLDEIGMGSATRATVQPDVPADCVISNYAFTELSGELQDAMIERHIARSRHGMIASNASLFARQIGGRTDKEVIAELRSHGLSATAHSSHPLLSASDQACGCVMIIW